MNDVYVANNKPRINMICDIRDMLSMELPDELYGLDILDGSPPCSSFSLAGVREKGWGKKKRFKEGQKLQVLDNLFFDFIALAKRLQPKVVVAENVKGLMVGNARKYLLGIITQFSQAGYYVRYFLLNSVSMGVPQRRERVFFICLRKDLIGNVAYERDGLFDIRPKLNMMFNEKHILVSQITDYAGQEMTHGKIYELWQKRNESDRMISQISQRELGVNKMFNLRIVHQDEVCPTITPRKTNFTHYDKPIHFSQMEFCKAQTFPLDYDFCGSDYSYVCGMSVPPVMMAQIATRVYEQWLSKIYTATPAKR